VEENIVRVEKIDSSNMLIELKPIKLENLFKNMNNSGFFLEMILLDKSDNHTNHGISIEAT